MRVSVLVPCHNYAHVVCDAVDSVFAQDFQGLARGKMQPVSLRKRVRQGAGALRQIVRGAS